MSTNSRRDSTGWGGFKLPVMGLLFLVGLSWAQVERKISIAVMPLVGQGVDDAASQVVTDALSNELLKSGKVRVMERSQMERILREQGFQSSGACDGSECALQVGRILSIDRMLVGSFGRLGGSFTISVRIVDVGTGEVVGSASRMQRGEIDEVVAHLMPKVAWDLVSNLEGLGNPESVSDKSTHTASPVGRSSEVVSTEKKQQGDRSSAPSKSNTTLELGSAGSLTYHGQVYKTVRIGRQNWMAQNLNFAGEGTPIGSCYKGIGDQCAKFGRLYTWDEVMIGHDDEKVGGFKIQGICPEGWYVPSDSDWSILEKFVDATNLKVGTKLKSAGSWNRRQSKLARYLGTDDFGFQALPAGFRDPEGTYADLGENGYWWTATEYTPTSAWDRLMNENDSKVYRVNNGKGNGFSLRCIQDLDEGDGSD